MTDWLTQAARGPKPEPTEFAALTMAALGFYAPPPRALLEEIARRLEC